MGKNKEGLSVKKADNFSSWYTQLVTKAELIEYYDISGCYILRPWAFSIWEVIQRYFDDQIKSIGVQNAYFPLLVSEAALTAEKDHIEGFSAEVAWVTKAGQSDMEQPVAIRPTSETIMYPAYAKWIRSHRDLPLQLNQWTNIVRWEFKHPVPFLRTREFLWQEGHSAFATLEQAAEEVTTILEFYRSVYEDVLAIPVVKGKKSELEKFAGGHYTTTIEGFIPSNGRAIQAATSHCLGQNFAKMFKIDFENEKGDRDLVWQNSWGLTTRTIGVMIMVHGDDKGLVLPPKVAPTQVVVIPLHFKNADTDAVDKKAQEVADELKSKGVRVHLDKRTHLNPGNKFAGWELKGVPMRIEIGPKDLAKDQVVVCRRDELTNKQGIATGDVVDHVVKELEVMQNSMFEKAKKTRDDHIIELTKWEEFVPALDKKNLVLAPWCDEKECEEEIKKKSKAESEAIEKGEEEGFKLTGSAKTLCIPFEQPKQGIQEDTKCFSCGKKAVHWTLFGRSY